MEQLRVPLELPHKMLFKFCALLYLWSLGIQDMAEYDICTAGLSMHDINDKEGIETMLYAASLIFMQSYLSCPDT
jgi:hypothetical protein